jgi:hypothetical protein
MNWFKAMIQPVTYIDGEKVSPKSQLAPLRVADGQLANQNPATRHWPLLMCLGPKHLVKQHNAPKWEGSGILKPLMPKWKINF